MRRLLFLTSHKFVEASWLVVLLSLSKVLYIVQESLVVGFLELFAVYVGELFALA